MSAVVKEKTTFENAPVITNWTVYRSGAAMTIVGTNIEGGVTTVTHVNTVEICFEPFPVVVGRRGADVVVLLATGGER